MFLFIVLLILVNLWGLPVRNPAMFAHAPLRVIHVDYVEHANWSWASKHSAFTRVYIIMCLLIMMRIAILAILLYSCFFFFCQRRGGSKHSNMRRVRVSVFIHTSRLVRFRKEQSVPCNRRFLCMCVSASLLW